MHGQPPAAEISAVDDVVVHQRGGVNELNDRRVENCPLSFVAAEPRRHQENRGTDPLSAAVLDVTPHLRDEGNPGLDVTDELPFNGLEIFADRLEDLRQVGRERGILHYVSQEVRFRKTASRY